MASSFYRLYPEKSHPTKLYGYKVVTAKEQKELVERLSRPTYSKLQGQMTTNEYRAKQRFHHDMSLVTPSTNTSLNLKFVTNNFQTSIKELKQNTMFQSTEKIDKQTVGENADSETLSSYSGQTADARLCPYSEKLVRIPQFVKPSSPRVHIQAVCVCPKGDQILKQIDKNLFLNRPESAKVYRPIDRSTIRRITWRLHSTKTRASEIRVRETRQFQKSLSARNCTHVNTLVSNNDARALLKITKPELRVSLFDTGGNFQHRKFINRWEQCEKVRHRVEWISRPTTASKMKQRYHCAVCEKSPMERGALGVVGDLAMEKSFGRSKTLETKSQESTLVERVLRPTLASQSECSVCYKLVQSDQPNLDNAKGKTRIQLSGEAIIERITRSAKTLPLISGLERSSGVHTITERLYSGACRRTDCQFRKMEEERQV